LLTESQRERISIVLVSPRNPLNIGAVARAMANFGFIRMHVVSPYQPHWREARSAIGAPELLRDAEETNLLADAIRDCSLVLGTGTLTHRKPEQPIVRLDNIAPLVSDALHRSERIALVFGPEKHGLTREDLSRCHYLVEIPTDPRQPSMNLGQAAAVCLYELATRMQSPSCDPESPRQDDEPHPTSGNLDALADLMEEVMTAANYSPQSMQAANRHDLRLLLRRLRLNAADIRRALGLFRRILWRIRRQENP
jgi:tRNA/rRNA methyltransferase